MVYHGSDFRLAPIQTQYNNSEFTLYVRFGGTEGLLQLSEHILKQTLDETEVASDSDYLLPQDPFAPACNLTWIFTPWLDRQLLTRLFSNSIDDNLTRFSWTNVPSGRNPEFPRRRTWHAMAQVTKSTIAMFGGVTSRQGVATNATFAILDQTWVFGPDRHKCNGTRLCELSQFKWMRLHTAESPSGRIMSAMVTLPQKNIAILYGGSTCLREVDALTSCVSNETWSLQILSITHTSAHGVWSLLVPTSSAHTPPARFRHAMSSLGASKVVLFGGKSRTGKIFSDTWILQTSTTGKLEWSEIDPARSRLAPPAMYGHVLFPGPAPYLHRPSQSGAPIVILAGGQREGDFECNTSWAFDLSTFGWNVVETSNASSLPPCSQGAAAGKF